MYLTLRAILIYFLTHDRTYIFYNILLLILIYFINPIDFTNLLLTYYPKKILPLLHTSFINQVFTLH